MDPVVHQMFDDLIHSFDAFRSEFDGLSARLDRRFTETEAVCSKHDSTVDRRLDSLEQFASAQYTAAIVADNWGGHFSERVSELEGRVHDLEMSVESEVQNISWESFSNLIHERFSHDQHELLLRQLFHIKHTSTVSDYIEKFTDLFEQLKAYNPNLDKLYFTTHFVDGLREDIRSVVMVARPQNLDTACTLALLQEEALDQGIRKEFKCSEASPFARTATIKGSLPLPLPPRRPQAVPDPVVEKRVPTKSTSIDDKLSTLRNYHRARGLCVRCGDKWALGHRTMQFKGSLLGRDVVILVDSGSSHSFLSSCLATGLPNLRPLPKPMTVRVADGGSILYSVEVSCAEWSVQGYSFHSTLRILQLGS
ncbi:unnamed protein product [Miscanthus lutarioriparius]|uniref:Retrotransposon gag domain-containing protein n=1 Tax=Miscanthus lutarioriparius TaxID=422564 RepID=A0A811Q559_9POAL|nr:unnamed protein product [Miscanthus lutarioriparius]